jgi:hypothetical protein
LPVWGKNCAVFVLAQGLASVDLRPSRSRLEAIVPQGERFVGQVMRGPVWDGLLREYYYERVFVDITVHRVATWPDLSASGDLRAFGATWPGPAGPQVPPKNGTGPRMDVDRAAGRIGMLPHRVLAYRGADGFPVVVPVEFAGHDAAGLRLVSTRGLLPPGGRRAACSPTPTGRSWSGSPPGPSPGGWRSPTMAARSTPRIPPRALSPRHARNCCWCPMGCSPNTGSGRPPPRHRQTAGTAGRA